MSFANHFFSNNSSSYLMNPCSSVCLSDKRSFNAAQVSRVLTLRSRSLWMLRTKAPESLNGKHSCDCAKPHKSKNMLASGCNIYSDLLSYDGSSAHSHPFVRLCLRTGCSHTQQISSSSWTQLGHVAYCWSRSSLWGNMRSLEKEALLW